MAAQRQLGIVLAAFIPSGDEHERLELAYGLLDSVLHDAAAPELSDAQRDELRARLAHHRAHPDEPGVTLTISAAS